MKIKGVLTCKKAIGFYIIIFMLFLFYLFSYFNIADKTYEAEIYMAGENGNFLDELKQGDIVQQQFCYQSEYLEGISVAFATFENTENNSGEIGCSVIDDETGTIFYEAKYDISTIKDNSYIKFEFDKAIECHKNQKLNFVVEVLSMGEGTRLTMLLGDNNIYPSYMLKVNNKKNSADLLMKVFYKKADTFKVIFCITWLLFSFFIVACYFIVIVMYGKIKLENIYLILALGLSFFYMMWILPQMVPDEGSHIATAYSISNKLLNEKVLAEDGTVYMRECDVKTKYLFNLARDDFSYVYENMFVQNTNTRMVKTDTKILDTYRFQYVFSALGISFARVIKLNGYLTLLMGRIFNLLVFVFIIRYAIKNIPFGKITLMLIALMPMTIQQGLSVSYDSTIISLAFLVIALAVKILYDKGQVKIYNYIIFCISSILLGLCKSGIYITVTFIIALGLFKFFKEDKKRVIRIGVSLIIIIISLFTIRIFDSKDSQYLSGDYSKGRIISWCNEEGYVLTEFIKKPQNIFNIIGNTIYNQFDFYIETMVGNSLGWLSISVPSHILYFILALILLSTCIEQNTQENCLKVTKMERICIILLACMSCALSVGGMFLEWTPKSSDYILGVQGRYFLPVFPAIMLMFKNTFIQLKKNIDSLLLFLLPILNCVILYCIQIYIARW